jgi:DNA-binding response OmpR family regulator
MKVLIAEDDPVSRRLLETGLAKWGYEVVSTKDGAEAWRSLQTADAPQLAVLDWMMPIMSGLEVCQKVRAHPGTKNMHLILLTAMHSRADILDGLNAGANDYITKPFDAEELRARVRVGERIVELQNSLAERVRELEAALSQVKQLQGLLPICLYCKKIRNDKNYWQQVESYIMEHAEVRFSHGICPECYEKVVKPTLARLGAGKPRPKGAAS